MQNDTIINGPSWLQSYCSWIYNYLCNQCQSPLKLWVWIPLMPWWRCVLDTTLCDKVCQWLVTGMCLWFSSSTLVSSTNKICSYNCVILHREVLFIFLQRINIGFSTIVFTGSVTSECKMYSEFILMSGKMKAKH
jgi:hypothetical protein